MPLYVLLDDHLNSCLESESISHLPSIINAFNRQDDSIPEIPLAAEAIFENASSTNTISPHSYVCIYSE